MKYKTTIILLTGIAAFFFGSFSISAQTLEKPIAVVVTDTIKNTSGKPILQIPIDSIEIIGNLKFKLFKNSAHASYYADKFTGKRTASGKRFDNKKYTAAHRKLPFGTKLRITNVANGKCVIVEVTDRGPFTKGREIDITKRAFMEIAHNKNIGGLNVTIEIIDKND
jgi:rare lipoprotein A